MGGYWYVDSQPYSAVLDALIAASNSSQIVLTTGTYSDPGFIASLAASKITGTLTKLQQHAQTAYYDAAGTWAQAQTFNGAVDVNGNVTATRILATSDSIAPTLETITNVSRVQIFSWYGSADNYIDVLGSLNIRMLPGLGTALSISAAGAATFNGDVSALSLNADVGSNKNLKSYRDGSVAGFYTGASVSSEAAWYMTASEHYFTIGGSTKFNVLSAGTYTTGEHTVTGALNFGAPINACRAFQDSGNLYIESDGTIFMRDTSTSIANWSLVNDGRTFIKTNVWHSDTDGNPRILYAGSGGATQFYANVLVGGTAKLGDFTVATLPSASAYTGYECNTTDSSVTTFGSTVAGGGSSNVKVRSNGTNWTVTGI